MSSPNPIVVNCGATHVSVSVFSASGGRLVLEKFYVRSLSYNYSNEGEWLEALTDALRILVKTAGISGTATVVVPGYRLLTKNIKVPLAESSQKQVIAMEAQRNLPDFEDMVWDSQTIASDEVESEVALFAHRNGEALHFTQAIFSAGLKPEIVEAATLLDYQAYRLKCDTAGIVDDVLLVNIGARSTNLTFVTPEGFSIQNTSVGGNLLTQSVADALGEDFRVAEELKVRFFMDEDMRRPGGERNEKIASVLTSKAQEFSKRLAQEISRRLINYKRQNKGRAPVRIELTGRASLLPGLVQYLAESLKISVEYFEPTATPRFSIGKGVSSGLLESVSRFQMSEVVGEAARLVIPNPVGVNLIPHEVAERMAFSRKKPFLVLAAILFAAAPWPIAWHYFKIAEVAKGQLTSVTQEFRDFDVYLKGEASTSLKEKGKTISSAADYLFRKRTEADSDQQRTGAVVKDGVEAIRKRAEDLGKRVEEMDALNAARSNWYFVLADLQKAIVQEGKHTWIESLAVERPKVAPFATPARGTTAKAPPPKEPTAILVTVRALLDEIPPGSPPNSNAESKKFSEIGKHLKGCLFVEKVVEVSADVSAGSNLPKRTFKLTVKPDYQL
ncbi:MAG: pilus assembly protein PilM [Puniceicoccales bacterium]|jgi:type IV pilus assembly protein PilM|nr:pilus assembly protein PilM [Puniceicoccales bacterium]